MAKIIKEYQKYGKTTKKVLLLLSAGLSLGLSGFPSRYFKILKAVGKEWDEIEGRSLHRAIKNLYNSNLVNLKVDENDMFILTLNDKGEKRVLKHELENMKIPKMKKWDKKWRMVLFDIPETKRKMRDALRFRLKELAFYEFQKSVFVHPFDCKNEIDFLIEFYNIRSYVRFMIVEGIDEEVDLKKYFGLR